MFTSRLLSNAHTVIARLMDYCSQHTPLCLAHLFFKYHCLETGTSCSFEERYNVLWGAYAYIHVYQRSRNHKHNNCFEIKARKREEGNSKKFFWVAVRSRYSYFRRSWLRGLDEPSLNKVQSVFFLYLKDSHIVVVSDRTNLRIHLWWK